MSSEKGGPRPPRGLARMAFRLPIWLYKLDLGWLLGKRALLLQHTGRKSGLVRETVLEVVRFNPDTNTFLVAAGFGETSDWFQNLLHTPRAHIQVGSQKFEVTAERVPFPEAVDEFRTYALNHPGALKVLGSLLGVKLTGSDEDYPFLGRLMPLVKLRSIRNL